MWVENAELLQRHAMDPGPISHLLIRGFASPIVAGTAQSFTITAEDAYGNRMIGYTGMVHVKIEDAGVTFPADEHLDDLPADYTFVSTDQGQHSFKATLKKAGRRTLNARELSLSGPMGFETLTVVPAAASTFTFRPDPSPALVGKPFGINVTVTDPYANQATNYSGTLHFTSSDPQANLPADYAFRPSDAGSHTFYIAFKTPGTQTVTGTDIVKSSLTGKSANIEVSPVQKGTL
jgi:hypothetical protein